MLDKLYKLYTEFACPVPEAMPAQAGMLPETVSAEALEKNCSWLGFSPEICGFCRGGLRLFTDTPQLIPLFRHCHEKLFTGPGRISPDKYASLRQWPNIPEELHPQSSMFYAYLLFSGIDWLKRESSSCGIPPEVVRDTLADIEIWMLDYHRRSGRPGLINKNWFASHFFSAFLRFGRLQFSHEKFPQPFLALRNKTDGTVIMVAEAGVLFRADGQFADADGQTATAPRESVFINQDGKITASPVSPVAGCITNPPVLLSENEYEIILKRGDGILGIHIPAGGGMDHEACGAAIGQAINSFPRYFPETNFKALTCVSWFLDPQFTAKLAPAANIRRFQEEFYLYPVPQANDSQLFNRVFGSLDFREHPEKAPRETSLQKLIIEHIQAGGRWRNGGCLMFPQDFNWGGQVYRQRKTAD